MLRFFGLVSPVEDLVKWMGQYHTRFSDSTWPMRSKNSDSRRFPATSIRFAMDLFDHDRLSAR